MIGQTVSLNWEATDNVGVRSVDAFISRHGARGPYDRLASGLSGEEGYAWTVTGPVSDSVTFKVVARDSASNAAPAWSQGLSRIVASLGVPPQLPGSKHAAITAIAPNPVRSALLVQFEIPERERVRLFLYDLQGRLAARLLDDVRPAGPSQLAIGLPQLNPRLGAGLYFVHLVSGADHAVARIAVVE